jgi:hypothetical protein
MKTTLLGETPSTTAVSPTQQAGDTIKLLSRRQIFGQFVWKAFTYGIAGGSAFGAIFGTFVVILFGTFVGALIGLFAGIFAGLVLGLICATVVVSLFYPMRDIEAFRWTLRFVGIFGTFVVSLLVTGWDGMWLAEPTHIFSLHTITLMTTGYAIYVVRKLETWYLNYVPHYRNNPQKGATKRLILAMCGLVVVGVLTANTILKAQSMHFHGQPGQEVIVFEHEQANYLMRIAPDGSDLARLTYHVADYIADQRFARTGGVRLANDGRGIVYTSNHTEGRDGSADAVDYQLELNGKPAYALEGDYNRYRLSPDRQFAALLQDGRALDWNRHAEHIWTYQTAGDQRWCLTCAFPDVYRFRGWSPDSQSVLLVKESLQRQTFYAVRYDGSQRIELANLENGRRDIFSWSPNSQHIAYVTVDNEKHTLHIQDLASRTVRSLEVGGGTAISYVRWAPDHRHVTIGTSRYLPKQRISLHTVYIVDTERMVSWQLDDSNVLSPPSWSPDSQRLVFETGGNIYVIDRDGSNMRQLTSGQPFTNPIWVRVP